MPPGRVIFFGPVYSSKILVRALAVCAVLAAFSILRVFVGGPSAYQLRDAILGSAYPLAWAVETPLLASFFLRYPLVGRLWPRVVAYFGVGIVAPILPLLVNRAVSHFAYAWRSMGNRTFLEWLSGFVIFWIVAGVFQTVAARQNVRELEDRLAQAELRNLKSQLQPHFLFNTLHTIAVLIRQDPGAAHAVLLKLSGLLRVSLDYSRADRIPLQQELEFLEAYLSIEQTRFQERLRTSISADANARAALVPTLLLQPIVENAVRHGLAPRAAGGCLSIAARRSGANLEIEVDDNGAGLAPDYLLRRERGSGLPNTEGRLRALYGAAARLSVSERPEGGVAVRISLPYCSHE
jgi:two-component system, LytTR family, sensor kinase